ncbi:folylpolyglutamate synthase [Kappamyces sp. JEL0829]|nr:folylpolyglutamate synthase [Kappamyces sp. JEL0829]
MIASILHASRTKCASFTSPHLIRERDSIRIDDAEIEQPLYDKARQQVLTANQSVGASPFELLTCTAFLAFSLAKVGLGGTLDATNVLPPPLVCVLCRIAVDHVDFLGSTPSEIAPHKAGIIKRGVAAVVIALQSQPLVTDIFVAKARDSHVERIVVVQQPLSLADGTDRVRLEFPAGVMSEASLLVEPGLIGSYQLENMATVLSVMHELARLEPFQSAVTSSTIRRGLELARNPGRLEWKETAKWGRILLDGAHNQDGIIALASHLRSMRQKTPHRIAFIFGLSGQKNCQDFLSILMMPDDMLLPVAFSQPEGMKWISPMDPSRIGASRPPGTELRDVHGSLEAALAAVDRTETPTVVVCGSLYLVADMYRLLETL